MFETMTQPVGAVMAKRRVLEHVNRSGEGGIGIKTLLETKIVDKESLAYLWMAIESDLNVLILGDEFSGRRPFLYSLFPLIPSYDKVMVFDCHPSNAKYYENMVSYISDRSADIKRALRSTGTFQVNRIIVPALEKFPKETFSCANKGIPFISTTKGEEPGIVDLLKKDRVPANTLSMLDIVVSIGRANESIWEIKSIYEYRWFARSEYFIEEAIASKNFEFEKSCIFEGGKFGAKNLGSSKTVQAYSDLNVVSKKETVEEFRHRSAFLGESLTSNLPSKEYVDSYFEIK